MHWTLIAHDTIAIEKVFIGATIIFDSIDIKCYFVK